MTQAIVKRDENTAQREGGQYLTFSVCGEIMAVDILDVDEIIENGSMTRVPMCNASVRGVINLRGNVVPVVDLAHRLRGKRTDIDKRTCVVLVNCLVEGENHTMGMLVDEVKEILDIPIHAVLKTPEFGTDIKHEFIANIGRVNDLFIIMLNLDRVLSIEELSDTHKSGESVKAATPSSAQ